MMKKYLLVLGLFLCVIQGKVKAEDRDMLEMMKIVILSQKYEECKKNTDDNKRLKCFDDLTQNTQELMKIYQNTLELKLGDLPIKEVEKEFQKEYKWGKEFFSDLEKVIEKLERYLE